MSKPQVVVTSDVTAFLAATEDFLQRSPVVHNVLLTRSAQALDEAADVRATQLWSWVLDGDDVVAAAMRTPPHGLALSTAGPDAVRALAAELAVRDTDLPGISGPVAPAMTFATHWRQLTGATAGASRRQRTYRCDVVRAPVEVPGRRRLARGDDAPLLRTWATAFEAETGTLVSATDHVGWRIEQGLLHVWDRDATPVSMTAVTLPSAGVSRVQLVYTPPAERGHGWASALVADLSQQVLNEGAIPMLYTDLANPVSNGIYQRIGYTAVADHALVAFHDGVAEPSRWAGVA